jgi:hypothetical protein
MNQASKTKGLSMMVVNLWTYSLDTHAMGHPPVETPDICSRSKKWELRKDIRDYPSAASSPRAPSARGVFFVVKAHVMLYVRVYRRHDLAA